MIPTNNRASTDYSNNPMGLARDQLICLGVTSVIVLIFVTLYYTVGDGSN